MYPYICKFKIHSTGTSIVRLCKYRYIQIYLSKHQRKRICIYRCIYKYIVPSIFELFVQNLEQNTCSIFCVYILRHLQMHLHLNVYRYTIETICFNFGETPIYVSTHGRLYELICSKLDKNTRDIFMHSHSDRFH